MNLFNLAVPALTWKRQLLHISCGLICVYYLGVPVTQAISTVTELGDRGVHSIAFIVGLLGQVASLLIEALIIRYVADSKSCSDYLNQNNRD